MISKISWISILLKKVAATQEMVDNRVVSRNEVSKRPIFLKQTTQVDPL
jgi:hypothetical protein